MRVRKMSGSFQEDMFQNRLGLCLCGEAIERIEFQEQSTGENLCIMCGLEWKWRGKAREKGKVASVFRV